MTNKHEHGEVKYRSIETEVFSNTLVDRPAPLLDRLLLHGGETDSISPIVANLSQLVD